MQQQFFKQAVLGIALLVLGATGLAGTAVAGGDHYYHGHSHYGEHSRKHHKRYHRKYHHSDNYYRQRQRSQYRQQRRHYRDHRYSHHYDKHGRPYYQHDRQRGNRHHLNDNRRHNRHYDEHYSKPVKPHRQQQCITYSVKAIGGMGGFRFQHNIKDFKRLDKHGYKGKVCGRENVEIELSKLDPAVKVVLKIDGKRFVYGAHSGHDRHINNWHRKYYSLNFNLAGHDY